MKKSISLLFFFLTATFFLNSNGIQNLSDKVSSSIDEFFSRIGNSRYTIINYENHSRLKNIELQRFYHLIVSSFERNDKNNFKDLLTGFGNNKGIFNQSRINLVSYTVSLKIVNNMDKIGVGIIIYNRNTENIVYIKYFEEIVKLSELELLRTAKNGSDEYEYIKSYEIKINKNLLDVCSFGDSDNSDTIFFLFPKKIDIYNFKNNGLKKIDSIPVKWGRPYYPSIDVEGKLFLYSNNGRKFVFAGINSSPKSLIFTYRDGILRLIGKLNFTVTSVFLLNGQKYLSGLRYFYGKNFFQGGLFLKIFNENNIETGETFKKKLPEFYSATIVKDNSDFNALYLIDKNYKLHVYSENMDEVANSNRRYGYSISTVNKFIGISDYLKVKDNFMILKNVTGIDNPIHTIKINGEIKFIKGGKFGGYIGFWILKSENNGNFNDYKLQFRRKNID